MKKIFGFLTAVTFLFGVVGLANATVLTFDDVPNVPTNSWAYFSGYSTSWGSTSSYDGEGWSITGNDGLTHAVLDTVDSDYEYGSISGEHVLFSPGTISYPWGNAAWISAEDGSDFTFGGMWARSLEGTRDFSIEGYLDGEMILSVFSLALDTDWSFYEGSAMLFDSLILNFGGSYAVDNLALNETGAAPVPEPSTMVLLGSGLAGLVAYRRKRKGE